MDSSDKFLKWVQGDVQDIVKIKCYQRSEDAHMYGGSEAKQVFILNASSLSDKYFIYFK